jgi:hypothetical protein
MALKRLRKTNACDRGGLNLVDHFSEHRAPLPVARDSGRDTFTEGSCDCVLWREPAEAQHGHSCDSERDHDQSGAPLKAAKECGGRNERNRKSGEARPRSAYEYGPYEKRRCACRSHLQDGMRHREDGNSERWTECDKTHEREMVWVSGEAARPTKMLRGMCYGPRSGDNARYGDEDQKVVQLAEARLPQRKYDQGGAGGENQSQEVDQTQASVDRCHRPEQPAYED